MVLVWKCVENEAEVEGVLSACRKLAGGRREGLQQKRAAAFEDPRRKDLRALLKMLKLRLVIVQHGMSFETGKL